MSLDLGIYGDYLLRMLVAAAIGGVVGLERDIKGKPAGMRTNILMCVGACLVMILSVEVARAAGPPADPGRIAAQVVTGVGFIGAGMILRSRVSVTGLTSAATIWFISALGLVVGYGDFLMAGSAAVLMMLTLTALNGVEKRFEKNRQMHIVRIRVARRDLGGVRDVLSQNRVVPEDVDLKALEDHVQLDLRYIGLSEKHLSLIESLGELDGVEIVHHY